MPWIRDKKLGYIDKETGEKYNSMGIDYFGFRRDGIHYNTKSLWDRDGYNQKGWNKWGINRFTGTEYDENGLDINGHKGEKATENLGYNTSENIKYYNSMGFDEEGYDRNGYNIHGYDKFGYDKFGYDIHGFDKDGFDCTGHDLNGLNEFGYDEDGYDIHGYNKDGYDINGLNKDGYDKDGFDINGLNKYGYDRNGYDKDGYDINGFDWYGFNEDGINKYTKNKYDEDGFDKDGLNKDGLDRNIVKGYHYVGVQFKNRRGSGFYQRTYVYKTKYNFKYGQIVNAQTRTGKNEARIVEEIIDTNNSTPNHIFIQTLDENDLINDPNDIIEQNNQEKEGHKRYNNGWMVD